MPLIFNGTTIPENVVSVFSFNSVNITQVIYNGVQVWNQLLGPVVGLFYGGSTGTYTNAVTRIDANGALVGSETAVGTARTGVAGASL